MPILRYRLLSLLLAGAALGLNGAVMAQSAPSVQVLPSTGLWWSPGENGQFLQVAIGPGGFVLATVSESDGRGQPTYRVLQGQYQPADPATGGEIGRIQSEFYRVVDSTCIECGPGNGRTVATGQRGALRFIDGTHAELLDSVRSLRRYELFPLITQANEVTAARLNGKRFVLSAMGQSETVRLEAGGAPALCASANPARKDFSIRFDDPAGRLAAAYGSVVLEVGEGVNPAIRGKAVVTSPLSPVCIRFQIPPLGINCLEFGPTPPPVSSCLTVFRVSEQGETLRGVAAPIVGLLNPTPQFSGALTLQPLPID
jgi:hypothetical protein